MTSENVQAAQLIAEGPQDIWLTGDPQASFFRSMYRRHVSYGMSVEKFNFNGDTVRFDRRGDLLGACYLTASDPVTNVQLSTFPISGIARVDLFIGGQLVDSQDTTFSSQVWPVTEATTWSERNVPSSFYPLHFFFCKDWSRAFPLVALEYHDIEIKIRDASSSYTFTLWVHMIHLSDPERAWYKRQPHKFLITQTQTARIDLQRDWGRFGGPIKYLAWPAKYFIPVNLSINATGGIETTYSSDGQTYKVHTFTSDGTFEVTYGGVVDVLIVGGGGAGSIDGNFFYEGTGGGGGGQVVYTTSVEVTSQSYSITVGLGGIISSSSPITTTFPQSSSAFGINANPGNNGGYLVGGSSGSGNIGGTSDIGGGAGGGGNAQVGESPIGDSSNGANGGDGTPNSITGTEVYYGGGGGGGTVSQNGLTPGLGGLGGGGTGSYYDNDSIPYTGTNGTDGTGGGGGGGSTARIQMPFVTRPGSGGNGIVIIRYII